MCGDFYFGFGPAGRPREKKAKVGPGRLEKSPPATRINEIRKKKRKIFNCLSGVEREYVKGN